MSRKGVRTYAFYCLRAGMKKNTPQILSPVRYVLTTVGSSGIYMRYDIMLVAVLVRKHTTITAGGGRRTRVADIVILQGFGRVGSSLAAQVASGQEIFGITRVWSSQEVFKFHGSDRAGLARLGSARIGSDRVGSSRARLDRVGSGRVGSGRVGSGRVGSGRVGSS